MGEVMVGGNIERSKYAGVCTFLCTGNMVWEIIIIIIFVHICEQ